VFVLVCSIVCVHVNAQLCVFAWDCV